MALSWMSGTMGPAAKEATATRGASRCPHAFSSHHRSLAHGHASSRVASVHLAPGRSAGGRAARVRVQAVVIDEDDLMQHADRVDWYEAKFVAADMPEWNRARFVRSADAAPGVRSVVLEVEVGRERVALANAYKAPGPRAAVRVNSGVTYELPVASPPPPQDVNRESMFRIRGDLFAHQIKTTVEPISVLAEVELLVDAKAAPDVFNLADGDEVEAGPFQGTGVDLRGSQIHAIYRYPTVVLLVSGAGIATARALVEGVGDANLLQLQFRQNVVLYYQAPNEASMCYRERFADWEARGCRVVATTGSLADAFDDDDQLEYDPASTAAVILTGGDVEAAAAARRLCEEAEIGLVTSDEVEQAAPVYHSATPRGFQRWSKKKIEQH